MVFHKDLYWDRWLFLIYINDLPKIILNTDSNKNTKIVSFADDTSVMVNNPNLTNFEWDINMVFKNMNECFSANLLSLNFGTPCNL